MEYKNKTADISTKKIEHTYTYQNAEVLELDIEYPHILIPWNRNSEYRINKAIISQVNAYLQEANQSLYQNAVENYIYSTEQGFPFNIHNITVRYTITLNHSCTLSQYRDKYIYQGGAHGNTLRQSDTFDMCTGGIIKLNSLFPSDSRWRSKLLAQVIKSADGNSNLYFENYRELIVKNFNPDSFYLTGNGVAIYYQQYEIGPYAIGIPVFEIPYQDLGIQPPRCNC